MLPKSQASNGKFWGTTSISLNSCWFLNLEIHEQSDQVHAFIHNCKWQWPSNLPIRFCRQLKIWICMEYNSGYHARLDKHKTTTYRLYLQEHSRNIFLHEIGETSWNHSNSQKSIRDVANLVINEKSNSKVTYHPCNGSLSPAGGWWTLRQL